MTNKLQARISGIGSYLPERVLSNHDLEKMVDTNDEWISSRTGIKERRIAAENEFCSDMAFKAAKKALTDSKVSPEEIDLIIVATATPDHPTPSTAAIVQGKIGACNAGALDIQAACTGYLYGLSMGKAFVESGMYRNILLIASDKMSAFVDYQDRNTCVIFGDGASAAMISAEGSGFLIDSICLGSDGEFSGLISIPAGGSRTPPTEETVKARQHYFHMAGKETFKHAVRRMSAAAKQCLKQAGMQKEQLSWIIPHQANKRIIDAIAKSFQVTDDKVGKTIHKYGNTSASSLAITLDELRTEQTINPGEHLLLVAFGAGLTWGASILTKTEE